MGEGEERVGVTIPAPRHSIFLSGKRYQANCICPLHRGAEPDQTVFGPGYYSSLDIVASRSSVSICQPAFESDVLYRIGPAIASAICLSRFFNALRVKPILVTRERSISAD